MVNANLLFLFDSLSTAIAPRKRIESVQGRIVLVAGANVGRSKSLQTVLTVLHELHWFSSLGSRAVASSFQRHRFSIVVSFATSQNGFS
jgi:hypothetical protein